MDIEGPIGFQVIAVKLAINLVRRVADALDLFMGCQTLPAELVLAPSARHMITAVSLLDAPTAPGARAFFADVVNHGFGSLFFGFPLFFLQGFQFRLLFRRQLLLGWFLVGRGGGSGIVGRFTGNGNGGRGIGTGGMGGILSFRVLQNTQGTVLDARPCNSACAPGPAKRLGGGIGAPWWIRTTGLKLRRLLLYPTELRARSKSVRPVLGTAVPEIVGVDLGLDRRGSGRRLDLVGKAARLAPLVSGCARIHIV